MGVRGNFDRIYCMPRVNFITFLVVSIFVLNFARGFAAETNAATELVTAIVKLHGATYRKRDQMQGVPAKARVTAPIVTEYSGDRSRVITEINLPQFGLLRQEQVTVGKRTAVRTTSPGITKKLEDAKRTLSVNTAKMLLREIMQVAAALQTGGLSTADLVRTAVNTGLEAKSTADAHAALDRAVNAFSSWHEIKDSEEEGETPLSFPTQLDSADVLFDVTKEVAAGGKIVKYTKRAPAIAGTPAVHTVLSVDSVTGFPKSEEMFLDGKSMMLTEYTDIGASISTEVPECLRAAGEQR